MTSSKLKIAIVGAGGVGGYFGGKLAAGGHDVTLIARGEHLRAIQTDGLYIESPDGNEHHENIAATDQPQSLGFVDIVIVAVKAWQLESVAPLIKPLVGTHTAVIPLLNGVEAVQTLASHLNPSNILNGLCGIIAQLDGPGRIKHIGIKPFIKFGETNNVKTERAEQFKSALIESSLKAEIPHDIDLAIWQKFIFIAPLSGVTAITRATIGSVRGLPETRDLLERSITETVEIAMSNGVALTRSDIANTLDNIDKAPADGTTSMQRDIESGRPSELDSQTGAVVRFSDASGISAPVNKLIYAALLPQERRSRS